MNKIVKINNIDPVQRRANVFCNKYIEKQNEYNPGLTVAKYFTKRYNVCTHIDWDVKRNKKISCLKW